jgi:hypothetical protein
LRTYLLGFSLKSALKIAQKLIFDEVWGKTSAGLGCEAAAGGLRRSVFRCQNGLKPNEYGRKRLFYL